MNTQEILDPTLEPSLEQQYQDMFHAQTQHPPNVPCSFAKDPGQTREPQSLKTGPLAGFTAHWDHKLQAWIIGANTVQAPLPGTYHPPAHTSGVSYRQCNHHQDDFKKIFWAQGYSLTCANENIIPKMRQEGYGVICRSLSVLKGYIGNDEQSSWSIAFHPAVPTAARLLFHIVDETNQDAYGWNPFETGLLLGYAEPDVFAWSFGTDQAKRAYPEEKFTRRKQFPVEEEKRNKVLGKRRIQSLLSPQEYGYSIAAMQPQADGEFETGAYQPPADLVERIRPHANMQREREADDRLSDRSIEIMKRCAQMRNKVSSANMQCEADDKSFHSSRFGLRLW